MSTVHRNSMEDPKRNVSDDSRSRLALVSDARGPDTSAPDARGTGHDVSSIRDGIAPLLPRIAAGDERAVRDCVLRYGALVWSLVRRSSVEDGDAEDAVQEVFIDLWRSAARFDATRMSEAGWVAMVARRRLIDRMRRRQRLPELEPLALDFDVADDGERDLDAVWRAERARQVLRELPAAQRQMLELSLVEGKTHDEIARDTGTPLGTVKSHIRRGLQRARTLLSDVEKR